MDDIIESKRTWANELKEINAIFGEPTDSTIDIFLPSDYVDSSVRNFDKQVSDAQKKVEDLEKAKAALGKGIIPEEWLKDISNRGKEFDFAKAIEDNIKELRDAKETLNYLLHGDKKDPSQKRTQKDPALTKLEKQIDLLKTARQEYEKLSKLMGGDSAFAELKKNSAFDGISHPIELTL